MLSIFFVTVVLLNLEYHFPSILTEGGSTRTIRNPPPTSNFLHVLGEYEVECRKADDWIQILTINVSFESSASSKKKECHLFYNEHLADLIIWEEEEEKEEEEEAEEEEEEEEDKVVEEIEKEEEEEEEEEEKEGGGEGNER
uniref:Uncharacterized protein n=1 Tax=Vespula pensylvanica TaxID=30213 RepID=A0A834P5V6_VESPE|nr:hypothetical protein H0235_005919 [Vespula pensylvanica]